MEYHQITINEWFEMKKQLRQELNNVRTSFVRVGYVLRKMNDSEAYKAEGYASIAEFAEKEHGLKPEKMQLPTHIDTLDIHKMLHFKQLSGILGIPEDYLRNLNPQYLHDIIPGSEKHSYTLRLPYNFTSDFVSQEDSVYTFMADSLFNPVMVSTVKEQAKTSSRITYIVKKGDFLGRIASRYHVSVAQLKRWNNLRSDNIRVGQRLYIHR